MYTAGVITISDRSYRGERQDKSGIIVKDLLEEYKYEVKNYEIIPDEPEMIQEKLIYYADTLNLNFVATTGGTGLGPRDNTPEATREVIDRLVPGIPEAMRTLCLKITLRAMLSRGVAGLRGSTLIINFPGSSRGAKESLEAIIEELPHGLDMILGREH